ncbi:MAG TPA: type III-A CRISPR-associated protein Csm2 [Dongiaceae bacterium]|nr:type III-A CRISPR-associated protein Csm2 [Dongiaceae bacterium]
MKQNRDGRGGGGGPRDRGGFGGGAAPSAEADAAFKEELKKIDLASPSPELFDTTAERIAGMLGRDENTNKASQIRRFYDEVTRYSDRLRRPDDREMLRKQLPFIRMINAKVAYAASRESGRGKLVDRNFQEFMRTCLGQVNSIETLQMFRLLFEAVIGFWPKEQARRYP